MRHNKTRVFALRFHQFNHFVSLAECADLNQVSWLDLVVIQFDIDDYSVLAFHVLLSRDVDLDLLVICILTQCEYQVADHLSQHRQVYSHTLRG